MRGGRNSKTERPAPGSGLAAWRKGAEEFALQRNQESVKGEGVYKLKGQRRRKLFQAAWDSTKSPRIAVKGLGLCSPTTGSLILGKLLYLFLPLLPQQ